MTPRRNLKPFVVTTPRREYAISASSPAAAISKVRWIVHGSAPADLSAWTVRTAADWLQARGIMVD